MPEGDALFRFARKVREVLEGEVIRGARAHGPGPVPQVERLVGATCTEVRAHGKNLLIGFDNGLTIRGHLRMHGTWHIYAAGETWTKPEREARLVLETGSAVVVNFSAPVVQMLETRALGLHSPISDLGPDPLRDDFDADEAFRRLRAPEREAVTIGDALMDQRAIAGVGNIWKHETLFRCGLNPWRLVRELSDPEVREAVDTAARLLRESAGLDLPGGKKRRPTMYVYARRGQPCLRCHTYLRSARQGRDIRFTTWCPACQPGSPAQEVQPPSPPRSAARLPGMGPRRA